MKLAIPATNPFVVASPESNPNNEMAPASPFPIGFSIAQDLATKLTAPAEELFKRSQTRLRTHFEDFHELEGFAVLGTSLDRLFSKVLLEVRSVFHEFHDSFQVIEELTSAKRKLTEEPGCQQMLCDHIAAEAQSLLERFGQLQIEHERKTEELHQFYEAQVKLQQKTWCIEAEKRHRYELRALAQEQQQQLELLAMESQQRLVEIKKRLEAKQQAQLEYMRVQLRLQVRAQMEREAASQVDAHKAACVRHREEVKLMQRRIRQCEEQRMSACERN
ncbi:hypothetical protein Gpo141_00001749 [Globisporangium polare]